MMETFFSRHTKTLDIDDHTREMLWKKRLIAVHYPHHYFEDGTKQLLDEDNNSHNPDDYDGRAAQIMRTLNKLSENGGYVCAEYHGHHRCLVGKVKPETKIKKVTGHWGSNSGLGGRTAVLKALPLQKVKLVKPQNYAVIFVGRPRHWTLSRWPRARNIIENIVEERESAPNFESLSSEQQEILCSEYMRLPEAENAGLPLMANLLLPVGRTMRDIDILGVDTTGTRIFAQVTYLDLRQAQGKLRRMSRYKDEIESHLVLFCKHDKVEIVEGVLVFPIEKVFKEFCSTFYGRNWLRHVVGSTG